jgi:hypothetical protein
MLKLQEPKDFSLYTAVDPTRISELHLAGFIPEYLYGSYVYFRTTEKLIEYLEKGYLELKPKKAEAVEVTAEKETKVNKESNTSYKYKKDKK